MIDAADAAKPATLGIGVTADEGRVVAGTEGAAATGNVAFWRIPLAPFPPLVRSSSSSCFLRCRASLIINNVAASFSMTDKSRAIFGVMAIVARSTPTLLKIALIRDTSLADISV